MGLLIGSMVAVQGIAYAATYPTAISRAKFAASLENAPGLGVLYGETKNLVSAEGYMAYRTVPFMGLIAAVWMLMTTTKLLRGQEEDGRWEIITAGATTSRQATGWLFAGLGVSFLCAFGISTVITGLSDLSPELALSPFTALLIIAAIFLPALVCTMVGLCVSQLSTTRRRSLMYGFCLLGLWFVLRAIGNSIPDLYWLKNFTPFGWADQLDPVLGPHTVWLLPFVATIFVLGIAGFYICAKRDLGTGLIREAQNVKSRFVLLGSAVQFTLRQHSLAFISWTIVALGISGVMVAITNVAVEAVADSPALAGAFGQLSGATDDLKAAFLGTGLILTVIILLIMVTVNVTVIRSSEAKNQLDTLLVAPLRRSSWLLSHFVMISLATLVVAMLTGIFTWILAHIQSIPLEFDTLALVSIALTGTAIFILGFGLFLYGLWPKIATAGMYLVIAWSFLVDLLHSMLTLPDTMLRSSLFYYLSLSPTQTPDWKTFAWLVALGIALAILGMVAFTKRDMVTE